MLDAVGSERYRALRQTLLAGAEHPQFDGTDDLDRPAATVARRHVRRRWRQLKRRVTALGDDPSDADLHRVRIAAKRCRYASEAAASPVGRRARRLAEAVAELQTVLGDHQDAVVAERWLRRAARAEPDAAVAAGALIAMQRARRTECRREWPRTWEHVSRKPLRRWL
jgi:CHAD domain-containing protein